MKRRNLLKYLGLNSALIFTAKSSVASPTDRAEESIAKGHNTVSRASNETNIPQNITGDIRTTVTSPFCGRSDAEQKEWNFIVKEVNEKLKLTLDDTVSSAINNNYCKIEKGFSYDQNESIDLFLPNHVERLLNEAADLIDRGIGIRATYEAVAAKYFELLLEIKEYIELDKIHQKEVLEGFYDINFLHTSDLVKSEEKLEASALNKKAMFSKLRDKFLETKDKVYQARRRKAWASPLPQQVNKTTKDKMENVEYEFKANDTRTPSTHILIAEQILAKYENAMQIAYYNGQNGIQTLEHEALTEKKNALKTVNIWNDVSRQFRIDRMCVARRFQDIKSKVSVNSDGVLNHGKRLNSLQKRFNQDFSDAISRLIVAREGLKMIYDDDTSLPTNVDPLDVFDEHLIWTKERIESLRKLKQGDQGLIWPISIRKFDSEIFVNGIPSGVWRFNLTFKDFNEISLVRLNGISCYIESKENDQNLWQVRIKPPSTAEYRYLDKTSRTYSQVDFIKDIYLGRVGSRYSNQDVDILGASSLLNSSPIGEWMVIIEGNLGDQTTLDINDVQIDFHLTFQNS